MAAEVRRLFSGRKRLTEAARQAQRLLLLPPALESAISKFVEDYPSGELKKDVSRLSVTLRNARDSVGWKESLAPEVEQETGPSEAAREALEEFARSRSARLKKVIGQPVLTEAMLYTEKSTAAYVAARMPAIYGAVHRVLSEVSRRVPDFRPSRLLDFGSGPGTVLWASNDIWPGITKTAVMIEPAQSMTHAFRSLLTDVQNFPLIRTYPSLLDLSRSVRRGPREHDLVISSYTLGELATMEDRISLVRQLWSFTSDILVLIEPGTPQGSATVREMRSHILQLERKKLRRQKQGAQMSKDGKKVISEVVVREGTKSAGAYVVAPCSHDGACPMDGLSTWCHFGQRLQRTPLQRIAKRQSQAPLRAYEDEKLSFVVLRRGVRLREKWPLDDWQQETSDKLEDSMEFLEFDPDDVDFDGSSFETATDSEFESDVEFSDLGEDIEGEDKPREPGVANLSTGWARIIRRPLRRGGHVVLDVCRSVDREGSGGTLNRVTFARKAKLARHLKAKKLMLGDLWPC